MDNFWACIWIPPPHHLCPINLPINLYDVHLRDLLLTNRSLISRGLTNKTKLSTAEKLEHENVGQISVPSSSEFRIVFWTNERLWNENVVAEMTEFSGLPFDLI